MTRPRTAQTGLGFAAAALLASCSAKHQLLTPPPWRHHAANWDDAKWAAVCGGKRATSLGLAWSSAVTADGVMEEYTGCDVTFNEDGWPLRIEVSLQSQETRILALLPPRADLLCSEVPDVVCPAIKRLATSARPMQHLMERAGGLQVTRSFEPGNNNDWQLRLAVTLSIVP